MWMMSKMTAKLQGCFTALDLIATPQALQVINVTRVCTVSKLTGILQVIPVGIEVRLKTAFSETCKFFLSQPCDNFYPKAKAFSMSAKHKRLSHTAAVTI